MAQSIFVLSRARLQIAHIVALIGIVTSPRPQRRISVTLSPRFLACRDSKLAFAV